VDRSDFFSSDAASGPHDLPALTGTVDRELNPDTCQNDHDFSVQPNIRILKFCNPKPQGAKVITITIFGEKILSKSNFYKLLNLDPNFFVIVCEDIFKMKKWPLFRTEH
jgi:hypothetical protein